MIKIALFIIILLIIPFHVYAEDWDDNVILPGTYNTDEELVHDYYYGWITGFVSPSVCTASMRVQLCLDYDGILTTVHVVVALSKAGLEWKTTSEFVGSGDPPYSSIGSSVSGSYWCTANIDDRLLSIDEAISSAAFCAQSTCTGTSGFQIDRKEATKVTDSQVSLSGTISSAGFSWTPSSTGSSGLAIDNFPSSSASNFINYKSFYVKGYVNLITAKVELKGQDEYGYARASSGVSLNIGH